MMPSYEQQNGWIRAYVMPLFDFNFAKVARNYRLRNLKLPISDERMAQFREDVLSEVREELDNAAKAHDPIFEYRYDDTYYNGTEIVRTVNHSAHGGGRLRLAELEINYIKDDPFFVIKKQVQGLVAKNGKVNELYKLCGSKTRASY